MNKWWTWVLVSVVTALGLLVGCAAPAAPAPTVAPAKPTAAPAAPATAVPTKPAALATAAPPAATTTPAAASGKDLAGSKFCARCHGASGEGGFGPVLAGTQATTAQAIAQVRTPRAKMPKFSDKQVSDAEIGSIIDYFKTQPKPATPGTYAFAAQAGDPTGKVRFIEKGCANCHGIPPSVAGTKLTATEEITQVRTPRNRMGAFTPAQVSDAEVTSINEWLRSLPAPTPQPTPQPSPTR